MVNFLTNLIFEEEDETSTEKKQAQPIAPEVKQVADEVKKTRGVAKVATASGGTFSEQIFEALNALMEKNNQPGNDYFEFKKALSAMASLNLSEDIMFKTTYATLSAGDLTMDVLKSSLKHYIGVIEHEKEIFLGEIDKLKTRAIGTLQETVNTEMKNIIAYQSKIQELQDKIQASGKVVEDSNALIEDKTSKITQKQNDFIVTADTMISHLQGDEVKIDKFLI